MARVIVATGMAPLLAAALPVPQDVQRAPRADAPPPKLGGLAARMLAKAGKPAAEHGGERVVSGDALVPVAINGRSLRLRIEPGVPGQVLVAPALKGELGLKKAGLLGLGICYGVGSGRGRQTACAGTHVVQFGWSGEKPAKRRIGLMWRFYQPPADGTVGPAGLPESVIRFALRPARAGERTATLPMYGGNGPFGVWRQIDGLTTINGAIVHELFDPHHPRSLANASAAIAIAAGNAGVMTPETGRQEIAFGIERPYRVMKLGRPLAIGALSLASIGVRVTDGDIAGRIAEEGDTAEATDPNEVVVTARKGRPPVNRLILGADALAACSSIVFDKAAREVRLTCGGDGER